MYHIVIGKFTVDEIGQMSSMKTFQGQEVKIDAAIGILGTGTH